MMSSKPTKIKVGCKDIVKMIQTSYLYCSLTAGELMYVG